MALSFPSSPTPGQIYVGPNGVSYVWDNTKAVWKTSGSGFLGIVTSVSGVSPIIVANGTSTPVISFDISVLPTLP